MKTLEESFNYSVLSRFINSMSGRIFRFIAGTGFLVVGYVFRDNPLGILSMAWSFFPLSAAILDICYISAVLGGPISGSAIRLRWKTGV